MTSILKNWAGNFEYSAVNVHHPQTVEQIQALVVHCKKLRVLGTRHSFNTIADSTENLLSLDQFTPLVSIDHERKTVTISATMNYGELGQILYREGYALHNLASLPHISVAGACSTATHGSGYHNQNLSAAVSALEFVAANGDLVMLSREQDSEQFAGAIVGLGGLGAVVKLTLDLLPTFEISQTVYENLPLAYLEDHFDEIMSSAYSVSLFTDWQGEVVNQVWLKKRTLDDSATTQQANFFGATPATVQMHPIAEISAENCTEQLGVPGPWHERLPHFRYDGTPSAGNELQSEYFVARSDAVAALRAVRTLRDDLATHLLITEIRSIAEDNFWMSPCYHQDSIAIHFTWKPNWPGVRPLLPMIESALAPFNARPHWAKLFTMPPLRLQSMYEKLTEFKQLLHQYDPEGKFRNAFLETAL